MYRILAAAVFAAGLAPSAMAGDDVSHVERVAITSKLAARGCVGDSDDIERKAWRKNGVKLSGYIYDCVKCKDGKEYDFILNKKFRIVSVRPTS